MKTYWHFEDVPIKCPKQFLHIEFICRGACKRPPKSGYFGGKFIAEQVLKSFSGRNDSLQSPIFRISNSLLYGLEESRELRILIQRLK